MKNEGAYVPTIGLEIHAELKTNTKMFCGCANAPLGAEPNAHICPICMGHPGTLPMVNRQAVESIVKVGIALQGTIASFSEFDRKNYFYPDIPKGYQISQYAYPIVQGGSLDGVAITRVHLEEDTARSLHDQSEGTIVDYNRAGVPLMELVTEPVIRSAEDASRFAKELQLLLRTIGVSDANMEMGQMRVEANISVSKDGTLGTKVEVKNLNSFKAVESAIRFEIKRHIEALEGGEKIIQETRGWDESKGKTFSQRKKESSHDYRYFPEPDIPKLNLSSDEAFNISRLSEIMNELPSNKRLKYKNLGLTRNQIEVIVSDLGAGSFFENLCKLSDDGELLSLAANYLTSDVLGLLVERKDQTLSNDRAEAFLALIKKVSSGEITSRVAKDLLGQILFEGKGAEELIAASGLTKKGGAELLPLIEEIIAEHSAVALEFKAGKESALQFLVGQGMRRSKGSADPQELAKLIREKLAS